MGKGYERLGEIHIGEDLPGLAVEPQFRFAQGIVDHLHVMPGQPFPKPKPACLEKGLLGGEAQGIMLGAMGLAGTILNLVGGEEPLEETDIALLKKALETADVNDVNPGTEDH